MMDELLQDEKQLLQLKAILEFNGCPSELERLAKVVNVACLMFVDKALVEIQAAKEKKAQANK